MVLSSKYWPVVSRRCSSSHRWNLDPWRRRKDGRWRIASARSSICSRCSFSHRNACSCWLACSGSNTGFGPEYRFWKFTFANVYSNFQRFGFVECRDLGWSSGIHPCWSLSETSWPDWKPVHSGTESWPRWY